MAERPVKIKEFSIRKEQMIKLNVFSDWVQELKLAINLKLKANKMESRKKRKTAKDNYARSLDNVESSLINPERICKRIQ